MKNMITIIINIDLMYSWIWLTLVSQKDRKMINNNYNQQTQENNFFLIENYLYVYVYNYIYYN